MKIKAVRDMTPAELEAYKATPKTCTGPCGRTLTVGQFKLTTSRGYKVFRPMCQDCLKGYYRRRCYKDTKTRRKLRMQCPVCGNIRCERERCKQERDELPYQPPYFRAGLFLQLDLRDKYLKRTRENLQKLIARKP